MSRGARQPSIDVAIVNWNTAEAAAEAAAGYLASDGVDVRVAIVDNDSAPEQRRLLQESLPAKVTLDLSDENLGFGTAINRGLRGGDAELVCISNPDLRPDAEALANLAAAALSNPRLGMVGPVFGETDSYHARLPGAATMLGRIFVGSFNSPSITSPEPGTTVEVEQPSGACFVMRRELWEQLGGFDESYFLWYDDVDLARRLRDRGFHGLVVGSARVEHVGAAAFKMMDDRHKQSIRLRSVEHYIRVHHPRIVPLAVPLLAISRRLRAVGAG